MDPYAVLEIGPDASDEEVRKAYIARAQERPPERDPEGFKTVRWAYERVRDAGARAEQFLDTFEELPMCIRDLPPVAPVPLRRSDPACRRARGRGLAPRFFGGSEMAAVILTRRGLLRYPAFALDETSGPTRVAGPEVRHEAHAAQTAPDGAAPPASLVERVEKIGKNFHRAAAQQEALAREVAEIRAHFRAAGPEPASSFVVEQLVPLVNALHRLVEVLAQHEDVGLAEGTRLVAARGDACLADLGIEPIPAAGERFHPRWHQARKVRPAPPDSEGRVIEVVVRGYRRGSKVLRPAQVIVGKREGRWKE